MPGPFLAPEISAHVCVSAPAEVARSAALGARADTSVGKVRAALIQNKPVPTVSLPGFVAYVPPATTRDKFTVRAAAAVDPADPSHGWVVVEAITPLGKSAIPLSLTVLLDASSSMYSSPMALVPANQDRGPKDPVVGTPRIDLAKAVLIDLLDRLPGRAMLSIVVFERDQASVVLPPTLAANATEIRRSIHRATSDLARKGRQGPLDIALGVTATSLDDCVDRRVLLITDEHARLSVDPADAMRAMVGWRERNVELWTLSLGVMGTHPEAVDALTQAGNGVFVPADTRSEATEPIAAALRASGTAVRDPQISVTFGPQVTKFTRADGVTGPGGTDTLVLPPTVDAGWRTVQLYEVELAVQKPVDGASTPPVEPVAQPVATVTARGGSPVPGDWTITVDEALIATPIAEAPALLRHRVFALALGKALAAEGAKGLAALAPLGEVLVREPGPAQELHTWTAIPARLAEKGVLPP